MGLQLEVGEAGLRGKARSHGIGLLIPILLYSYRKREVLFRYNAMVSTMSQRVRTLESRIRKIKQEIAALGPLRPGTLSQQFNVCGKAGCRCKATPPRKHGPYYQLSFTWQGRSSSHFVRRKDLEAVEKQLRNYRRLRELVDEWATLGMELSQLHGKPSLPSGRPARRRQTLA